METLISLIAEVVRSVSHMHIIPEWFGRLSPIQQAGLTVGVEIVFAILCFAIYQLYSYYRLKRMADRDGDYLDEIMRGE